MNFVLVLEQTLNGLQLGVMLFLMAAGLTLVFGIMQLVTLARGSFYMVGAYLATYFYQATGSYLLGVSLGLAGTLAVGVAVERVALRTLYERDHLDQVLATFGLILFFNELAAILWGRAAIYTTLPDYLSGHVELFAGLRYPLYRLVIIAVGLAGGTCAGRPRPPAARSAPGRAASGWRPPRQPARLLSPPLLAPRPRGVVPAGAPAPPAAGPRCGPLSHPARRRRAYPRTSI